MLVLLLYPAVALAIFVGVMRGLQRMSISHPELRNPMAFMVESLTVFSLLNVVSGFFLVATRRTTPAPPWEVHAGILFWAVLGAGTLFIAQTAALRWWPLGVPPVLASLLLLALAPLNASLFTGIVVCLVTGVLQVRSFVVGPTSGRRHRPSHTEA